MGRIKNYHKSIKAQHDEYQKLVDELNAMAERSGGLESMKVLQKHLDRFEEFAAKGKRDVWEGLADSLQKDFDAESEYLQKQMVTLSDKLTKIYVAMQADVKEALRYVEDKLKALNSWNCPMCKGKGFIRAPEEKHKYYEGLLEFLQKI